MNYKHYIMNYDRIDDSEGIDVIKANESKIVIFFTIGIFLIKGLSFNQMSAMGVMMY